MPFFTEKKYQNEEIYDLGHFFYDLGHFCFNLTKNMIFDVRKI